MQQDASIGATETEIFDSELFEMLRGRYLEGLLETPILDDIRYATGDDVASANQSNRNDGRALISSGQVGAVILCGGLATRFGGQPKAAVELLPGWTLLRVKLQTLSGVAAAHGANMQVLIITSAATDDAVHIILDRHAFARLQITVVRQSILPRMLPDGELLRHPDGSLAFNPPGHGEVLKLLGQHGEPVRTWQISNIDNLLATLDADIVGAHLTGRKAATVEVASGTPEDVGGYLAHGPEGLQILEGFQVQLAARPKGPFFLSTNTFLVDRQAVAAAGELPYFAVTKSAADGRTAVQFEQLLGSLGAFVPLNAVAVSREGISSRFGPMKVVTDLDRSRAALIDALTASGLVAWEDRAPSGR